MVVGSPASVRDCAFSMRDRGRGIHRPVEHLMRRARRLQCGHGSGLPASTTTSITSHEPNPSVVGQPLPVRYLVTSPNGTPTGNVTTTDGTASCSGTVSAGTCTRSHQRAPGRRRSPATYASNGNFAGSSDTKSTRSTRPRRQRQSPGTTQILRRPGNR